MSAHEVCSSAQGQAWAESTCTVHTTPSCASGAMLCVMPCLYFRFPAGSASAGTMPFSAASTSTAVSSEGAGAAVWDGNERAEAEVLLTQQAGVRMTLNRAPVWKRHFAMHSSLPTCTVLPCCAGWSTCCTRGTAPAARFALPAAYLRVALCPTALLCRMEYVLHPDPNGPHPVDGWPGNPWIYQVRASLFC